MNLLKGIVHPKMKILSSFTHPQVVANLHEFLSSSEHKGKYLEERLEPNSCLPQLTSIVEKKNRMEASKSMVPKFQSFFKISSFVFIRRKKLIQVCKNLRVNEL